MVNPPNFDSLEKFLDENGYKLVREIELKEETDLRDSHKVFINPKSMYNLFRDVGFHNEIITRTIFRDNKHFLKMHVRD